MGKLAKALTASAGNAGSDPLYVEDVFSTYLYAGNGGTQTITNGIDLAGKGGLVWVKNRDAAEKNVLSYGTNKFLSSNETSATSTNPNYVTQFSNNGFNIGAGSPVNANNQDIASWTFRKAEKFFDIVEWTGNGVSGRAIAHNLGSVPGMIMIKRTNATGDDWAVFHTNLGPTKLIALNTNGGSITNPWLTNTAPTASVFTLNNYGFINASGGEYIAYLFASDAGGFGDDEDENIIKCGSFSASGNYDPIDVALGFEPQWILIKPLASSDWNIMDTTRLITVDRQDLSLAPNTTAAETGLNRTGIRSSGFVYVPGFTNTPFIYMAIRRGPMKTPDDATKVFAIDTARFSAAPKFRSPFPVDLGWYLTNVNDTGSSIVADRLRGPKELNFNYNYNQGGLATGKFDYMNGWSSLTGVNSSSYSWMLQRAPGFFDAVSYIGTGSGTGITLNHNLTVTPELLICKAATLSQDWTVWRTGAASGVFERLNSEYGSTSPGYVLSTISATQFGWNNSDGAVNDNGATYIAYLFATLAGVSKVGTYTGTGSDLNVDCGFSNGARFILIKRIAAGPVADWYYWDSLRGITAGNDPYLTTNSLAAQVTNTDYIDPLSSGFTVTSSAPAALNGNGNTYLFLAIA